MLKACLAVFTMDQNAARKVLKFKGIGSKRGCRMCNIKGVHNGARRAYYYLHCGFDDFDDIDQNEDMLACDDEHVHRYNFEQMPLRRGVKRLMIQVDRGNREADRKRTGISGLSAYIRRPTLHFTRSFPYDTLHFILQNLVPQLIKLWYGDTPFDD